MFDWNVVGKIDRLEVLITQIQLAINANPKASSWLVRYKDEAHNGLLQKANEVLSKEGLKLSYGGGVYMYIEEEGDLYTVEMNDFQIMATRRQIQAIRANLNTNIKSALVGVELVGKPDFIGDIVDDT